MDALQERKSTYPERFEVLTAVLLKTEVFWNVMLCHCMSSSEHSEGSQCLHLHIQAVQEHATHHSRSKCQELPAQ